MYKKIEIEATRIIHFLPLEKNKDGLYPMPTMRCGVLPVYLDKDNQIIWGCIESNRVGPLTITPPAGIQDIIIMKEGLCFNLEVGKPFPDLNFDFLSTFIGRLFRDQTYQDILACFIENKFHLYIENPLMTAIHETQEEHGVDLRMKGRDRQIVDTLLELPLQKLSGKQGATAQYTCIAFLKNGDNVVLNDTQKIENKIRRNLGRSFYEKGCWGTLEAFKKIVVSESIKFNSGEQTYYTPQQMDLITETLSANQESIEFLENIELLVRSTLEEFKSVKILAEDKFNQNFSHDSYGNMVLNVPHKRNNASLLETAGFFNTNNLLQKEQSLKEQNTYLGL